MNHYKTLKLSKNCTQEQIKSSYRKLAKETHPDTGGDPEEFKKIQQAYECLSDPTNRKIYDKTNSEDLDIEDLKKKLTHLIEMSMSGSNPIQSMSIALDTSLADSYHRSAQLALELASTQKECEAFTKMNKNHLLHDIFFSAYNNRIERIKKQIESTKQEIAEVKAIKKLLEDLNFSFHNSQGLNYFVNNYFNTYKSPV